MKLIIGNQNYSSWSMRPWLFINYHKLDVEFEKLVLFTEQTREKLGRHFSGGKVPLLVDGDLEVWDTMAILEYLSEKFPETRAWPQDSAARAVARAVSAEMHSSFGATFRKMRIRLRDHALDLGNRDHRQEAHEQQEEGEEQSERSQIGHHINHGRFVVGPVGREKIAMQ